MKLLKLSNQYYFVGILAASILGSIFAFYIIKYTINEEFNQKLYAEKEELLHELNTYDEVLPKYMLNIGDKIHIKKATYIPQVTTIIQDTVMYSMYEKKLLNHRKITFYKKIKGQDYIISITKSLLSQQNLVKGVLVIFLAILLLFFVTMVFLTNFISKVIWKPFYQTLSQLQFYNVKNPDPLQLSSTIVDEFNSLNSSIEKMTTKVEKDYVALKEYTENVTHEIQTPLAIIKNKIELLIQDKTLTQDHIIALAKIHESTGRLSRLNKNLSILTKIDNNQFVENSEIFLADFIREKIEDFEELLTLKGINITTKFDFNPQLLLNETLADLLFNNLISNAIKHNIKEGEIIIEITDKSFVIKNTGKPLEISKLKLFNRFSKPTNNLNSTGLGLFLVKKIISYYNFYLAYKNEGNWHTISIFFVYKQII
ncbi:HAMP domain-containing sensor histidine kinase [Tenacibaculum sp. IB213877]|uniref:sensor histidine kinase n=1 Tax=Tenacibaculum sp. IB213877 TaxID=3097351 RepID=UPI002A59D929|nr:HAMP domain-containing sensor histidine kinase [Tenacibaculum sp. IB213877]MDY0780509.1 HAMP domain-containing sensor histidine kinase [Tenacibaculum sp. IB213877]